MMTALTYLLMCFLYFICISLDVAMFFLQIRLILMWKNIHWLAPFDNAGKSLVDIIATKVPQLLMTRNPLSQRGRLIAALVVLALVRIVLGAVLRPG